jgi:hypothetical protein
MNTKNSDRPEKAAAERWRLAIRRLARLRVLLVCLAAVATVCAFVVVFDPTLNPSPFSPSSFVFAAVMLWVPAWQADSTLKMFKKFHG